MRRSYLIGVHLLLLLFTVLSTCGSAEQNAGDGADGADARGKTTIFLVRHAEKAGGEDPELTAEGIQRADRLRELLAGKNLTAVYSTATTRTEMTATPTAKDHGLTVTTYDAGDLAGFARQLKSGRRGESVLVVGHSNTTPTLVNQLTGTTNLSAIDESDFGNLYVVTIGRNDNVKLDQRRY